MPVLRRLAAPPAVALLLLAFPANAADERALLACGEAFDACETRCERSYVDDAAAEAGCIAACAADRAVCEAKAGYEQAKPWVADQFRKMQRFFEGFSEQGRDLAPQPPPQQDGPAPLLPQPEDEAPDEGPVDL